MSQSRAHSALEAVTNVVVGFAIALATQLLAFPVVGLHASLRQNLGIGALFTTVSLVRSYLLRRIFDRWPMRTR
jgi:hypothetical protein